MATGLVPADPAGATAGLLAAWLDYERGEGASPATLDTYRRGIFRFVAWLAAGRGSETGEVTPQLVRSYKLELTAGYGPQTVNLQLSAIRSLFRFLVTTGRAAGNPAAEVKGVKRPKSWQHRRDELTGSEVVGVLQTCDPAAPAGLRDRAILTLMAYCALRTIEVHRANLGNLKTQGGRLVLEVQGKGRLEADAVVIIPSRQEPAIRAWLARRLTLKPHGRGDPLFVSLSNRSRGGRLSARAIRAMVKGRYLAAGVAGEGKTAHSLRHSAISTAIRRGAAPGQVQAMARHASFDTTLQYYHEISRLANPAEDLVDYDSG